MRGLGAGRRPMEKHNSNGYGFNKRVLVDEMSSTFFKMIDEINSVKTKFDDAVRAEITTAQTCVESCHENGVHIFNDIFIEWIPRLDLLKTILNLATNRVESIDQHPNLRNTDQEVLNGTADTNDVSIVTNGSAMNDQNKFTSPKVINSEPSNQKKSNPATGAIPKNILQKMAPATAIVMDSRGRNSSTDSSSYHTCPEVPKIVVDESTKVQPTNRTDPTIQELALMRSNDEEYVDVDSIPTFAQRRLTTNMPILNIGSDETFLGDICFVKSPSQFYVQKTDNKKDLANIVTILEQNYEKKQRMLRAPQILKLFQDNTLEGTFWVCKFQDDGKYYRVRVTSPASEKSLYNIQFIDYGNDDVASIEELHVLIPSLAEIPVQAFECSLFDVAPSTGSIWSSEDTEYLENAGTSSVQLEITVREKRTERLNAASFYPAIAVDLINKDDVSGSTINEKFIDENRGMRKKSSLPSPRKCDKEPVTSNVTPMPNGSKSQNVPQKMRTLITAPKMAQAKSGSVKSEGSTSKKLGLIRSSKPSETTAEKVLLQLKKTYQSPEPEEDWDDDINDHEHGNAYGTDLDDPMTAVMGFKTENVNYCRFYAEGSCSKGDFCPYPHISKQSLDHAVLNSIEETPLDLMHQEPLVLNEIYSIQIISYNTKNKIFRVKSPFGSKPLTKPDLDMLSDESFSTRFEKQYKALMLEMSLKYSKKESQEPQNIYPAKGSLVAVRDKNVTKSFFRARVLESQPEKDQIDVSCLDTGISGQVKRQDVFKLHNEFTLLPSMTYMAKIPSISDQSSIEALMKSSLRLNVKVIELDNVTGEDIATLQMVNYASHFPS